MTAEGKVVEYYFPCSGGADYSPASLPGVAGGMSGESQVCIDGIAEESGKNASHQDASGRTCRISKQQPQFCDFLRGDSAPNAGGGVVSRMCFWG